MAMYPDKSIFKQSLLLLPFKTPVDYDYSSSHLSNLFEVSKVRMASVGREKLLLTV